MKALSSSKILFSILISSIFCVHAQSDLKEEAGALNTLIQRNHYSPLPLSDSICDLIAMETVYNLDPRRTIFTADEVKQIREKSFILTSDLKGITWEFIPRLSKIYNAALLRSQKHVETFLSKPVKLNAVDTLFPPYEQPFGAVAEELEKRKQKYLKHQVLSRLHSLSDSILNNPTLLASHELKARERVKKTELKKISNIVDGKDGIERYLTNHLFNAYTNTLDAHSVYLPKSLFANLRAELDTEELSFGLELKENEEGDVIISRLYPGGPAWKTNQLFKDDILITIKMRGLMEEYVEGAGMDEVSRILQNHNEITLVVRETNGRLKDVPLKKERLRREENKVKGIILKGERKIGYISLPGFYTEWENSEAGCSNDVAREILKLKEDGIEGIILDIRYNGGGSLYEGLNMAGIFINEGPLYLKKDRDQKVQVVKDMNRGTVYDGPLVVMINGQSASASELVAAVLQDYNRALIVGSTSYGKATGQSMMPVDTSTQSRLAWKESIRNENGYTLITTQKLFRITGKTAQLNGVSPDINLPDYMEGLEDREADMPTALSAEEVVKKVYYTPLPALPVEELRKRSTGRVQATSMKKIPTLLTEYKSIPDYRVLNLQSYKNRYSRYSSVWKELESIISVKDSVFSCENTSEMKKVLELDEYERENNTVLREGLEKDTYLQESFRIITDMINLK